MQIRESLQKLISSILTGMGVLDSQTVKEQVQEIAEYDRAITEVINLIFFQLNPLKICLI